jgi:hypothetical protein
VIGFFAADFFNTLFSWDRADEPERGNFREMAEQEEGIENGQCGLCGFYNTVCLLYVSRPNSQGIGGERVKRIEYVYVTTTVSLSVVSTPDQWMEDTLCLG